MVKSRITASFTWAIIAIAWLASRLSILTVFSLGPMIGGIAYKVSRKRRRIAEINVDLCFPHYNAKEKQQLLKDIFKDNFSESQTNQLNFIHNKDITAEQLLEGCSGVSSEASMRSNIRISLKKQI
mgnify:CR=1 FL=1